MRMNKEYAEAMHKYRDRIEGVSGTPAKGVMWGLGLSIPFWVAVGALLFLTGCSGYVGAINRAGLAMHDLHGTGDDVRGMHDMLERACPREELRCKRIWGSLGYEPTKGLGMSVGE